MSDFLRFVLTHPVWSVLGLVLSVITVGKWLHPRVETFG